MRIINEITNLQNIFDKLERNMNVKTIIFLQMYIPYCDEMKRILNDNIYIHIRCDESTDYSSFSLSSQK